MNRIQLQLKALPSEFLNIMSVDFAGTTEHLDALWNCEWASLLESHIVTDIFTRKFVNVSIDDGADVLPIAIAALQAFVQANFVGPSLESTVAFGKLTWHAILSEVGAHVIQDFLIIDGEEVNRNARHLELLAVAKFLFARIAKRTAADAQPAIESFVQQQWLLRFSGIYQSVIDEKCSTLYENIASISKELYRLLRLLPTELDRESGAICLLEIVQWQLHYRQVNTAKEYLDHAQNDLHVDVVVEGRLGRRTKHQIDAKPILTVSVTPRSGQQVLACNGSADNCSTPETAVKLPTLLQLDDEVLLERPRFENEADNAIFNTNRLSQALVLATL